MGQPSLAFIDVENFQFDPRLEEVKQLCRGQNDQAAKSLAGLCLPRDSLGERGRRSFDEKVGQF